MPSSPNYYGSIINLLAEELLSLSEIKTALQVSMPTLRRVIQELVDARWVRAVGQSTGSSGRPAALYGLDDSYYFIVGIHLQLPGIHLVVIDLNGGVIEETTLPASTSTLPDDVLHTITTTINETIDRYPDRQILGVGVATPGYVDSNTGEILTINRVPAWQNLPLRSRLESGLGIPVTIDNDFDAIATAELHYSDAPSSDDLIYLGFQEGIKASMFLRGELYKGPFGNAGIIGRTTITDELGRETILEDLFSMQAICTQFIRAADPTIRAHMKVKNQRNRRLRFEGILQLAAEGDALCRRIVDPMLHQLALSIGNLLYIVQPSVLIIGGALSTMPDVLYQELNSGIRRRIPPIISNRLVIERARLSEPGSVAMGVARQFLQSFVNSDSFIQIKNETA